MPTLLNELGAYISESLSSTPPVYDDFKPDMPDSAIVLSEYSGLPTTTGVKAVYRNVQVLVRAKKMEDARNLAHSLYKLLDTPEERVVWINDDRWALISARQPPFKFETDNARRVSYVFNIRILTYKE